MSIQISSGLFTFHANKFLGYGGSLGCLLLRKTSDVEGQLQ